MTGRGGEIGLDLLDFLKKQKNVIAGITGRVLVSYLVAISTLWYC